jgi:hypothetical protein
MTINPQKHVLIDVAGREVEVTITDDGNLTVDAPHYLTPDATKEISLTAAWKKNGVTQYTKSGYSDHPAVFPHPEDPEIVLVESGESLYARLSQYAQEDLLNDIQKMTETLDSLGETIQH